MKKQKSSDPLNGLWRKIAAVGFIIAILLGWFAVKTHAQETVPQTQAVLKGYFTTGNRPTQANYWELIDTFFWYVNQTYANSLAAASSAQNSTVLYQAYSGFSLSTASGIAVATNSPYNVSSIVVTSVGSTAPLPTWFGTSVSLENYGEYKCVVSFSNTLAGANYRFMVSSPGCVTNFTSATQSLGVYVQGLSGTNGGDLSASIPLVSKAATSCTFYFFTGSSANLNGLNGTVIIQ